MSGEINDKQFFQKMQKEVKKKIQMGDVAALTSNTTCDLELGPFSYFGEDGVIKLKKKAKRVTCAIAKTDCLLFRFAKDPFWLNYQMISKKFSTTSPNNL